MWISKQVHSSVPVCMSINYVPSHLKMRKIFRNYNLLCIWCGQLHCLVYLFPKKGSQVRRVE
jgi:hypothetical protein